MLSLRVVLYLTVSMIFIFASGLYAEDSHDHTRMVMAAQKEKPEILETVKLDEQLGEIINLDTWFSDENNRRIKLESLFDKPVVLLPVFFKCTAVCDFLQADLANALNIVNPVPGKDFNVITLSFSDDEN